MYSLNIVLLWKNKNVQMSLWIILQLIFIYHASLDKSDCNYIYIRITHLTLMFRVEFGHLILCFLKYNWIATEYIICDPYHFNG